MRLDKVKRKYRGKDHRKKCDKDWEQTLLETSHYRSEILGC